MLNESHLLLVTSPYLSPCLYPIAAPNRYQDYAKSLGPTMRPGIFLSEWLAGALPSSILSLEAGEYHEDILQPV